MYLIYGLPVGARGCQTVWINIARPFYRSNSSLFIFPSPSPFAICIFHFTPLFPFLSCLVFFPSPFPLYSPTFLSPLPPLLLCHPLHIAILHSLCKYLLRVLFNLHRANRTPHARLAPPRHDALMTPTHPLHGGVGSDLPVCLPDAISLPSPVTRHTVRNRPLPVCSPGNNTYGEHHARVDQVLLQSAPLTYSIIKYQVMSTSGPVMYYIDVSTPSTRDNLDA